MDSKGLSQRGGLVLVAALALAGLIGLVPALAADSVGLEAGPAQISGLAAANAYGGKVNLSWTASTAQDFGRYHIYVSNTELTDVAGLSPDYQITDISTNYYQVTGLDDGQAYYFAVTATDAGGEEDTQVTCASATPTAMTRGTVDPDLSVSVYQSDRTWPGTTLLADNHNELSPRIIEVNMLGEIVWQYTVPDYLIGHTNPGFDAERLSNGNALIGFPTYGIIEVDRDLNVVWEYRDSRMSHDVDRLANGNTLTVFGAFDQFNDAQVKEVDPSGQIVWQWSASDHYNLAPYNEVSYQGWTHANSTTRMDDGTTYVSLRNFNFIAHLDQTGAVLGQYGIGNVYSPHDPEIHSGGQRIIAASQAPLEGYLTQNQDAFHGAVLFDTQTNQLDWRWGRDHVEWAGQLTRDANLLTNGNVLIVGSNKIVEVSPAGEIVWELDLDFTFSSDDRSSRGFYKAQRIDS